MDTAQYCLEKAAPAGSSIYYATRFHTPISRRHLLAFLALQTELSETVAGCQDPGVARMKLQWWGEELQRIPRGEARHPVSREIHTLIPALDLEKIPLTHLLHWAEEEISPLPADSLESVLTGLARGKATIWSRMVTQITPGMDHSLLETVKRLGALYYAVEWMQTAARHLQRGYCPFPLDLMSKHGLSHEQLLHPQDPGDIGFMLHELFQQLQILLANAVQGFKGREFNSIIFALSLARMAEANCRILKNESDLRHLQSNGITPLRKLWIAWRVARGCANSTGPR